MSFPPATLGSGLFDGTASNSAVGQDVVLANMLGSGLFDETTSNSAVMKDQGNCFVVHVEAVETDGTLQWVKRGTLRRGYIICSIEAAWEKAVQLFGDGVRSFSAEHRHDGCIGVTCVRSRLPS